MYPFAELLERVQGVNLKTTKFELESEVEKGEIVVGELPDNLKMLYIASMELGNELQTQCNEFHPRVEKLAKKYAKSNPNRPKEIDLDDLALLQGHDLEHRKKDLFMDHFWICAEKAFVKHRFHDNNIGLRKGWKVVTWHDRVKMAHELQSFLDEVLSTNPS